MGIKLKFGYFWFFFPPLTRIILKQTTSMVQVICKEKNYSILLSCKEEKEMNSRI